MTQDIMMVGDQETLTTRLHQLARAGRLVALTRPVPQGQGGMWQMTVTVRPVAVPAPPEPRHRREGASVKVLALLGTVALALLGTVALALAYAIRWLVAHPAVVIIGVGVAVMILATVIRSYSRGHHCPGCPG